MIIARYRNHPIQIEDIQDDKVLARTLDDSRPFKAKVARLDPEASPFPEYHQVDWAWVNREDLTDIQCTHVHSILETNGGFHFSHEIGPWDDIEERLICLDCGQEIKPTSSIDDLPANLGGSDHESTE